MTNLCEKDLYGTDVLDALMGAEYDLIIWGEDLYSSRIVVYPAKIRSIPDYKTIEPNLINAALVYFNYRQDQFIKFTFVRFDEANNVVYIPKGNFCSSWPNIRESIKAGICHQKDAGNELSVNKPEDLVDLSLLNRPSSEAVIQKGHIVYKQKKISSEEIENKKRKQSALDNPKYRYFYSSLSNVYHDKSCEDIKTISPDNFRFSETIPEGRSLCRKCMTTILLREGCDPYVKIIPQVWLLLKKAGMRDYKLEKYIRDYNLKFRMDFDDELVVKGKEDTWIIKGFGKQNLSLWHNNYVKTGPGERYITNGFHEQHWEGRSIFSMFEYINNYTYEKHLVAESNKILEQKTNENTTVIKNEFSTVSKAVGTNHINSHEGLKSIFSRILQTIIQKLAFNHEREEKDDNYSV